MKKRHWFFIGAILVLVLVGLAARFLPTSSLIRGVTKMKALSFEGPLLWLKGTGMVFGIILGVVLVLGILGGISSSIVFWVLAPTNRFFTFIKEGTAKIVVRGDQFEKALMRWEGHDFAGGLGVDRWTIVASQIPKPKPRFGGLAFYGPWPIFDIVRWTQRWHDLQRDEKENQKPQFHEKKVDYLLLRSDVYWTIVKGAETSPQAEERIPIDVEFLVTMKVTNPYKVVYVAPINWTENVMARLEALFRSYIAGKTLDEIIAKKGESEAVWKDLENEPFVQTLKTDWGIEIESGGIQIRDIVLPEEYQKAAAAQRTEEMKARGTQQRIDIEWGAVQKYGDLGKLIKALEAMEKSQLTATVMLQAVPGLSELFRGIFGRTPPEEVSPEELRQLREAITKLAQKVEQFSQPKPSE